MHTSWRLLDLPLSDYRSVLKLQESILADTIAGQSEDTLILVEHRPVFTFGNRSDPANLKVNKRFLEARNIGLVKTRRGGGITYHGPGQIVAYPIVSLKEHNLSIPDYVNLLEEVMLQTANTFGIKAHRSQKNRGVWCGQRKLGSIGIGMKRWVSYHGLALNTNMDLAPFSWINPCGLKGTAITSLAEETPQNVSVRKVKATLLEAFKNVFQVSLTQLNREHHESTRNKKAGLA